MFLIFKIFPDWFWWLLLSSGLICFFLSYLPQAKPYELLLKSLGCITIAATIFIFGMIYADNTWKSAAAELQAKVVEAVKQSDDLNSQLKDKIINRVQTVQVRKDGIVKYIDREVIRYDGTCEIPPAFIQAHNRAAKAPE